MEVVTVEVGEVATGEEMAKAVEEVAVVEGQPCTFWGRRCRPFLLMAHQNSKRFV